MWPPYTVKRAPTGKLLEAYNKCKQRKAALMTRPDGKPAAAVEATSVAGVAPACAIAVRVQW